MSLRRLAEFLEARAAFREYLQTDKESARAGEFAIGTNIGLTRLVGNLLQDEKFPGVHGIITYKDVPEVPRRALSGEPAYAGEPVAAIAAESEAIAGAEAKVAHELT